MFGKVIEDRVLFSYFSFCQVPVDHFNNEAAHKKKTN